MSTFCGLFKKILMSDSDPHRGYYRQLKIKLLKIFLLVEIKLKYKYWLKNFKRKLKMLPRQ